MDTSSPPRIFLPWVTRMRRFPCKDKSEDKFGSVLLLRGSNPLSLFPNFSSQRGRQEASGCLHQRQGTSRFWVRVRTLLIWVGIHTEPDHHQENCCGHWDWLHLLGSYRDCNLPPCCQCQVGPGVPKRYPTHFKEQPSGLKRSVSSKALKCLSINIVTLKYKFLPYAEHLNKFPLFIAVFRPLAYQGAIFFTVKRKLNVVYAKYLQKFFTRF